MVSIKHINIYNSPELPHRPIFWELFGRKETYVEYTQSPSLASLGILLPECDKLFRQPLCLLCLWPCRRYRFVCEEGGDEISEESLPM